MVEKPFEVGIDDLVRKFSIEERLYRLTRCVEAWSMAVPWSGFPWPSSSNWRSRCRRPRISAWKPSSISRSRPDRSSRGFRGPMSRASPWRKRPTSSPSWHRRLRQADRQAARRADPSGGAVEVWVQAHQVDRALVVHRQAAEELLAGPAGLRIRLLGQRQSGVPHPRWSQATEELIGTASAGRRCCSTATPNRSRVSTRAWKTRSGCGRDADATVSCLILKRPRSGRLEGWPKSHLQLMLRRIASPGFSA